MTEVLQSPSSSSSPSISTPTHSSALFIHQAESYLGVDEGFAANVTGGDTEVELEEGEEESGVREKRESERREQLSLLALLLALFRKSFWVTCKADRADFAGSSGGGMEISWPSDVQHVNHVTFDRFDGFLGLPVEFEPEVPRRPPSASATVFGVSTESMQLSYDSRGNSIPTILLLMQRHLYSQGGLEAEGIFRITAGNSQEEFVRNQLNSGVVPQGIDVHCLAGLIKAWFRELPRGVLDSLSPEQVMQCQTEEDCDALVRLLPPTEAALLDWAINLMADVVQNEHRNKMNARNIAMVFAPNMTKMADPLTALMYAVQVMNFLKTLIEKTVRDREDSAVDPNPAPQMDSNDDSGNQSSSLVHRDDARGSDEEGGKKWDFVREDPGSDSGLETSQVEHNTDDDFVSYSTYTEEESDESVFCDTPAAAVQVCNKVKQQGLDEFEGNDSGKTAQTSDVPSQTMSEAKDDCQNNKNKGISNLSRINSMTERFEAWR